MSDLASFTEIVIRDAVSGKMIATQVFLEHERSQGGDPVVTLASLPVPVKGFRCYVDDATGGGVPCYADGVDWRRYSNDAVVS